MKIAYILSTCEKYKDTRVKQQTESFSKYIDMNDVYYLSCKMDIDNRIFGWNSLDDSFNIIFKYIYFFQNVTLDYDWYFFGDDDTYVFHERLVSLLKSKSKPSFMDIGNNSSAINNFMVFIVNVIIYQLNYKFFTKSYEAFIQN